jgi:hypothetical protein
MTWKLRQEFHQQKTDLLELVVFPTSFLDNDDDGPPSDQD